MKIMSSAPIDRKNRLEQLDNFIATAKDNLSSIVSSLGWSIESFSKNAETMLRCPFDESHRVPERSWEKHLEECQWKCEGYAKDDLPLSVGWLPSEAQSSIKFDVQLQDSVIQNAKLGNPNMATGAVGRLIPRTCDRFVADFTREERCAMYEYVIANTIQPDLGEDIADMNKPTQPGNGTRSSYLELLAQERNLKRRRAKYRGVHTNKKSQVEILREIITQQMEMLGEYISEKNCDDRFSHSRNNFPGDDLPQGRGEKDAIKNENTRSDERRWRVAECDESESSRSRKKSQDTDFWSGRSNERSADRGNDRFRDNNYYHDADHGFRKEEKKKRSRERRREISRDRNSHKSRHRKHDSKNRHDEQRHGRRRSRDREESRSSRVSKHEDRKSESSRDSRRDERRAKKPRRSRD